MQFQELEKLGYSGFALGFFDVDVQSVHTSDCATCVSPEITDYFRSLIISSKFA